jgi:hypothetical protein
MNKKNIRKEEKSREIFLVDRYRDLVEVPAPTREDPRGGRHHFAPDDEGAFEYGNYHNPDHTY